MVFRIFIALFLIYGPHLNASDISNSKTLTPAKLKEIRRGNRSYQECLKSAAKTATEPTQLPELMKQCREKFPAAGLYTECKQRRLKGLAKGSVNFSKELQECRKLLVAQSFDGVNMVPFFLQDNEMFFAGIGLNQPSTIGALDPPNFSCERLQTAFSDPQRANYFLFGNDPTLFTPTSPDSYKDYLKKQLNPKKGSSILLPGLGKVDGVGKDPVLYFPMAACDYDGQTEDKKFSGISLYYLMQYQTKVATPHAGIIFYKDAQLKTSELARTISSRLGPSFTAIQKNESTTFFAEADILDRDGEGDPKNLCKKPRLNRFLLVLQSHAGQPERPEFLLVANIKNLCDYGDHVANYVATIKSRR
jgi:hypothetical protein